MPSRNTVAPAGAALKVRLTFCGKMVTELVDCSPLESVTVRLTRYRVKSLKSWPAGRDRERATRHAGDRSAGMHMRVVQEVDVPGVGTRGQRAVLRVGRGAAEVDDVTRPERRSIGRGQNGHRRPIARTDAQRVRNRGIHSVGYREPDLIGPGCGVRVRWVGRRRRGVIAEVPRIAQRLAFGIGGAGAGEVHHQRRRARSSGWPRPAPRAAGWNRRS